MSYVPAGSLFLFYFLFLQVNWKSDVCHAVVGESGSAGQVRNVFYMCRSHNTFVKDRNIHEELVEGHILLCECANEIVELKPGNRQYWLVVEFGIVEAIEEMNSARPRRGKTNTEFARELCIAA